MHALTPSDSSQYVYKKTLVARQWPTTMLRALIITAYAELKYNNALYMTKELSNLPSFNCSQAQAPLRQCL